MSMPEAGGLLADSFPMDVKKINDLDPLNEHEVYRGEHRDVKDITEGMKALNSEGEPKLTCEETDGREATVEDDFGFFAMDEDEDLQGREPQQEQNAPSTSGSDNSSDQLDLSGRSRGRRKKSVLKHRSSYGEGDDAIPLDFERNEFNRVLPKPQLHGARLASSHPDKGFIRSGSTGLFRVSSEPVFVRPVYQSDDDVEEEDIEISVHSTGHTPTTRHSKGFVEGQMKKRISFGTIKIREHAQTIGDNPSCTYGAPVQLDWEHQDMEEIKVEEYEEYKPQARRKEEFHLNSFQRANLLKLNGHSNNEIKASKKEVSKARGQRERTKFLVLNYPQLVTVNDAIESGLRKVKRSVSKSKLNGDGIILRKSSKDDLGVHSSGLSKALLLENMDNDISNVTAAF